jgi:hypothetical protein
MMWGCQGAKLGIGELPGCTNTSCSIERWTNLISLDHTCSTITLSILWGHIMTLVESCFVASIHVLSYVLNTLRMPINTQSSGSCRRI